MFDESNAVTSFQTNWTKLYFVSHE